MLQSSDVLIVTSGSSRISEEDSDSGLLEQFREETKQELDEKYNMHKKNSSIAQICHSKYLNGLVSSNLQRQKHLDRLTTSFKSLETALARSPSSMPSMISRLSCSLTEDSLFKIDKKIQESRDRLKQALEEQEALKHIQQKEKKNLEIWKERLDHLRDFNKKVEQAHEKAFETRGVALNNMAQAYNQTSTFKKVSKITKNKYYNLYAKRKNELQSHQNDIEMSIENISQYKLAIHNRCKNSSVFDDSSIDDDSKPIFTIRNHLESLNEALALHKEQLVDEINDETTDRLIELFKSCSFLENSLSSQYQQLIKTRVEKEKQLESIESTLLEHKENVHQEKKFKETYNQMNVSLKEQQELTNDKEKVNYFEQLALRCYMNFQSISTQSMHYVHEIESLSFNILASDSNFGKMDKLIKELCKGFYKKEVLPSGKQHVTVSVMERESFEIYSGDKVKLDLSFFPLNFKDICKAMLSMNTDRLKSKRLAGILHEIPIVCYFFTLSALKSCIQDKKPFESIMKEAYSNFQLQIKKLPECLLNVMNILKETTQIIAQELRPPENNIYERKTSRLPSIRHAKKQSSSVKNRYKPIEHPKQKQEESSQRKKKISMDFDIKRSKRMIKKKEFEVMSPADIRKELLVSDRRLFSIKLKEKNVIMNSTAKSPCLEEFIKKIRPVKSYSALDHN